MATQVARLCEVFVAYVTLIWSLVGVFAEVIPQITTLTKDGHAARVLAAIVLLGALAVLAVDLDHLVPVRRDALEILDGAGFFRGCFCC